MATPKKTAYNRNNEGHFWDSEKVKKEQKKNKIASHPA